ncbi:unnamed protein product, partial [Amoebophrya sp. A25]
TLAPEVPTTAVPNSTNGSNYTGDPIIVDNATLQQNSRVAMAEQDLKQQQLELNEKTAMVAMKTLAAKKLEERRKEEWTLKQSQLKGQEEAVKIRTAELQRQNEIETKQARNETEALRLEELAAKDTLQQEQESATKKMDRQQAEA